MNEEWFCTVFPNDLDKMPQDFPTWEEAIQYADEEYGKGNYTIETPF